MFETLRHPSSFCQFIGDTKIEATDAGVAELVDATDLKSVVLFGRAGSSPALGTFYIIVIFVSRWDTRSYDLCVLFLSW